MQLLNANFCWTEPSITWVILALTPFRSDDDPEWVIRSQMQLLHANSCWAEPSIPWVILAFTPFRSDDDPEWVMPVPDAVTPCKGYDTCIHMDCAKCYDPYLGSHTTCGKMTYYDCNRSLPSMCRPVKCTDSDVREVIT